MLRTPLTELLGSTVPVVNAPMGGQAGPPLAAAVTAGGATGMVGIGPATAPDEARRALEEAGPGCGAGLLAWSLDDERKADALVDALAAAAPVLVSVSYGPWRRAAARLRDAGVPVATTAGTVDAAREAADAGVDVLVVRGGEGGGHGRDQVATLPLLQQVLDDVAHPCVVAAGGVGSARGLAAVLAAGAAGAWLGTALLATPEAGVGDRQREALLAAGGTDTVHSRVHDLASPWPWPAEFGGRSLRDRWTDGWAGREEDLDAATLDAIRESARTGETDVVWAGQGVGMLTERRSATDVVTTLGVGARELLGRWA